VRLLPLALVPADWIDRSIAIEYLKTLCLKDSNMKLIYIYFDYQEVKVQTLANVVGSLLKQLVSQLESVPAEVDKIYEKAIQRAARPETTKLCELLFSLSKTFRTFAVFDAMDECNEGVQDSMFTLVAGLQKSDCNLLVSSRPHLQQLKNLSPRIPFNVMADESDIQNYISFRLKEKRIRNETLIARCLELSTGAEGMCNPSSIHSLLVGSC